jgi:hypothetical protein
MGQRRAGEREESGGGKRPAEIGRSHWSVLSVRRG